MSGCSAIERWHEIIGRRRDQMDAIYASLGRTSRDFWNRRAAAFHRATTDTASEDPVFEKVRSIVDERSSVLDVGAGTGRFTIALAPHVARMIAVEPNEAMRGFIEREATARGLTNVEIIPTGWEAVADDVRADVVICSHVLYPIEDVEPFLRKLDRAALRACFITMRAVHQDTVTNPLWEHFHGEPRCISPTYIAALDVLAEMGIFADVEVVDHVPNWRWETLDDAVEQHLEALILPDTPEARGELRRLLADFLVRRDGAFVLPVDNLPNAIISWRQPAHRAGVPAH